MVRRGDGTKPWAVSIFVSDLAEIVTGHASQRRWRRQQGVGGYDDGGRGETSEFEDEEEV